MKRSATWVVSVGLGWAVLGSELAYEVASAVTHLTSDFYLQNEALDAVLRALLRFADVRLVGAVLASALCFVCVALFRAPSRVWLGVMLGVVVAALLQLFLTAYVALVFGVFSGVSLDMFLREDLVFGLIAIVAAWVGSSLATRWVAFSAGLRSAVDADECQAEAKLPEPFVPDDWDEPFDLRAYDERA